MSAQEVYLNELAQGIRPMSEGAAWFTSLEEDQMRSVLRELAGFATQAGATDRDVEGAIKSSAVKPTATPAVLLRRPNLRSQLAKVANLPKPELLAAFPLFVALLNRADDRRRRTRCAGGCQHWWHNLQPPQRSVSD